MHDNFVLLLDIVKIVNLEGSRITQKTTPGHIGED